MKTKNFLLAGILGIALSGFVLTGCHKDSTSPDTDISAAEDESNASNVSNDSKSVSDAAVTQGNSTDYGRVRPSISSSCKVTFNIDTASSGTDTMYVTFPSTPTLCLDGKYREGQIIVYWNNTNHSVWRAYFDSGATVHMTFNGYARGNSSSNMVQINGNRSWTNNGGQISMSDMNAVNWSFSANLTLKYLATGKTATWNSNRTNTLVYNAPTSTWFYEITGSASGVAQSGVAYTLTITEPLYHTAFPWWFGSGNGCPWIEAGQVTITRQGKTNSLVITFGTLGTCSDQATATIGGNTYTIYMN